MSEPVSAPIPVAGRVYRIELCSGELRRWRCLGNDARGQVCWQDVESGMEFNDGSLMYAWRLVGEEPPAAS